MFGILPRLNQLQDHEITPAGTHSISGLKSGLEITIFELLLLSTSAIKAESAWPV
jgi:hypothetical protein